MPSGGEVFVFGTGSALHHDRECIEGSDTPDDRVRVYADPDGDLWHAVVDGKPAAQALVNVAGRAVTKVCGGCALRPASS